jgi:ubiquitin conjugation factor E4 B
MVMISKTCTENFMNYKLGERLSNLLNYSLDLFTSQRGLKLKVKNMSDYGFDPKFVLRALISTYVSFYDYKEFMEFIVKDERSYKIENFEKVLRIYQRGKIKIDYEELVKFQKMTEILKEIENEMKSKFINYDDAPEEFIDPITTQIMSYPVMLPSSRVIVDRSTIETHLLSDPTDPFNRTKLTIEMLVPVEDLKLKIDEYKKSKGFNNI